MRPERMLVADIAVLRSVQQAAATKVSGRPRTSSTVPRRTKWTEQLLLSKTKISSRAIATAHTPGGRWWSAIHASRGSTLRARTSRGATAFPKCGTATSAWRSGIRRRAAARAISRNSPVHQRERRPRRAARGTRPTANLRPPRRPHSTPPSVPRPPLPSSPEGRSAILQEGIRSNWRMERRGCFPGGTI